VIELAKKAVKTITESALKREVGRLDKSLTQMLGLLKEIRGELKLTNKNTGQMIEVQRQMINMQKQTMETQKQLIASMKTAAPRRAKKPRKLTEMNVFVRDQIRSGKTFAEAIRAWKEYKALKVTPEKIETKPVSEPTETPPPTSTETQNTGTA